MLAVCCYQFIFSYTDNRIFANEYSAAQEGKKFYLIKILNILASYTEVLKFMAANDGGGKTHDSTLPTDEAKIEKI